MGWDDGLPDARPAHPVWVDGFRLARTPVTNAEFGAFLRASGAPPPPFWADPRLSDPEQPVVGVTWDEAVLFCEWLTRESGHPHRLPTEAEWERAARGGRESARYPWGDEPPARWFGEPAGTPARAPARRTGAGQRLRADGSRRRRPRMVPGLVRRRRVRPGAGPRADGSAGGLSPRVARRRLAPSGAVEPGGPPLEPAASPPLLGLRLPGGPRDPAGNDRRPGPRAHRRHREPMTTHRHARRPKPVPDREPSDQLPRRGS